MNPTLLFAALTFVLPLGTGLVRAQAADRSTGQEPVRQESEEDGGLRRVAPAPDGQQERAHTQLFARDFDHADWKERLQHPDLDQRLESFEGLLKRARFDPLARAFLEDLARDPKGGELAWTARLALRELGRARFLVQRSLTDPLALGDHMQRMLNEWMARDGMALFLPPASAPKVPRPVGQAQGSQRGSPRTVRIEQTKTGARVEILSGLDGQGGARTFEGRSLDEIMELNPVLRQELRGLRFRVDAETPLDLCFDLDGVADAGSRGSGRLAPEGRAHPLWTDKLGVLVQKITPEHAHELGLVGQGLYVEHSYPQTFAHVLGVGSGDVLLELNDVTLCEIDDIEKGLRARARDGTLTLVWIDELGQRQKKTWPSGRGR